MTSKNKITCKLRNIYIAGQHYRHLRWSLEIIKHKYNIHAKDDKSTLNKKRLKHEMEPALTTV